MEGQGEELLTVSSVELHEVCVAGSQRTLLYKGPLRVLAFPGRPSSLGAFSVELHVGTLKLPLARERQCLEPAPGVFLLSISPGSNVFYCVAVEASPGGDGHNRDVNLLREVLEQSCSYQMRCDRQEVASTSTPEDVKLLGVSSKTLSRGISMGSKGLAWGIKSAGSAVGWSVKKVGEVSVQQGWVSESKDGPAKVSPELKAALEATSKVTAGAVDVVTAAASGVGSVVGAAAKKGAKAFQASESGKRLSSSKSGKLLEELGTAALVGFAEVMEAMEQAVIILCQESAAATAKVVHHRHGEEAAEATLCAMRSTGNIGASYLALRMLAKKELAIAAATSVAKKKKEKELNSQRLDRRAAELAIESALEPAPSIVAEDPTRGKALTAAGPC